MHRLLDSNRQIKQVDIAIKQDASISSRRTLPEPLDRQFSLAKEE
jgi:hypothetical protein